MIDLTPIESRGIIKHQFVVTSDEPVTIEVCVTDDGAVIAHVYKGQNVGEHDEPVGAYDSTTGENTNWEVK